MAVEVDGNFRPHFIHTLEKCILLRAHSVLKKLFELKRLEYIEIERLAKLELDTESESEVHDCKEFFDSL